MQHTLDMPPRFQPAQRQKGKVYTARSATLVAEFRLMTLDEKDQQHRHNRTKTSAMTSSTGEREGNKTLHIPGEAHSQHDLSEQI